MSRLIFQALVLSEFVLEMDCQVVELALLVEDHLQIQLVNVLLTAVSRQKIDNFLIINFSRINGDGRQILHSCRLTF